MHKNSRIFIAGHRGLVGSAIVRNLQNSGYKNLIMKTRKDCDLTQASQVQKFFSEEKPEYVFLAAAKVGGIWANQTRKAEFIRENLLIQTHVLEEAHQNQVKKLLFLGSSCIYPRLARQPISESELLNGSLEPSNDAYAIAKIAGILACQAYRQQYGSNFIACMPTNLYGPQDNFDLENSHVLPAMLHKFHWAKIRDLPEVVLWGSGKPMREFLHVDDMASACTHLMHHWDSEEIVNIGTGVDVTIRELAETIQKVVGYSGKIVWDSSRPDGTPRKLLDVTRLKESGFQAKTSLQEGIESTYAWFLQNYEASENQMIKRSEA